MLNVNAELFWILAGMTVAALLQAFVLLGIFLTVRKAVQAAKEQADEYRGKVKPLLDAGVELVTVGRNLSVSAQSLIDDLKPQILAAATELADMTRDIRDQVNRLQAAVDDVAQKAHHQADRVNGMTTTFLNGVDRFGTFLNEAVQAPIRQVNGFVAAARAVVETLRSPTSGRAQAAARPRPRPGSQAVRSADDRDLFV